MIPGHGSAGVVALDALLELCRANLGAMVQVIDGPPAAIELADDNLFVGYGGADGPAILSTQEAVDYTGRAREEGDVLCVISSYTGDDDMALLRSRVNAILDALCATLRAEQGLGGAVDGAWLGESLEWSQASVEDGLACRVAFTVHYVAEL